MGCHTVRPSACHVAQGCLLAHLLSCRCADGKWGAKVSSYCHPIAYFPFQVRQVCFVYLGVFSLGVSICERMSANRCFDHCDVSSSVSGKRLVFKPSPRIDGASCVLFVFTLVWCMFYILDFQPRCIFESKVMFLKPCIMRSFVAVVPFSVSLRSFIHICIECDHWQL